MTVGVCLRVVVRGVSPLIVRTIEVPGWVSLPQLHRILLACFGWSGECLHVFEIRGRRYSDAGYVDAERSTDITVGSLGLRVDERFCWRYDFCSDWVIDARVEAVGDGAVVRVVSGRRAGPAEWVDGPDRFAVWEDAHSMFEVANIVADVIAAGPVDGPAMLRDRLWPLAEWLGRDMFDRARIEGAVLDACGCEELLEVSSCNSLSKSASNPTTPMVLVS
jgi:hypothetical protein